MLRAKRARANLDGAEQRRTKMTFLPKAAAGGLALALALLMAGPAQGARGQPSYFEEPGFGNLDVNRDGYLTPNEVQARSTIYGDWTRYDRNADQLIDPLEYPGPGGGTSEFSAFEPMGTVPGGTLPHSSQSGPAQDGSLGYFVW
jgi:hypothetical protein